MREFFQTIVDDRIHPAPQKLLGKPEKQAFLFSMSDSTMLKINDSAMVILSGIGTRSRDKNTKHSLIVNTTFSKYLIVRCKQRKIKKYKEEEGMYELRFFFFIF